MNKIKKWIQNYISEERIPIKAWLLDIIVLINLIPVIQANIFTKSKGNASSQLYVGITFVIEILLICWYFIKYHVKFNKKTIKYFFVYCILTVILLITSVIMYFKGIWNIKDIFDIASKFCTIVLLIIAFTSAKIDSKELKKFYQFLIGLGIVACVYNFIFYFNEIIHLWDVKNSYTANIKSFFGNRNQFALFLMMISMGNLFVLMNEGNKKNKVLYGISLMIMFINMFFTMSRTAISGTIIFMLISIISIVKKKQKIMILAIAFLVILAIVIGIALFSPELVEKIIRLFIRPDTIATGGGRTKIWKEGANIVLRENPISGVGRFTGVDQLNIYLKELGLRTTQFHSVYIETFVSMGLLGIIGLIYLSVKNVRGLLKATLPKKEKNIVLCMVITYLIIGGVESCRFSIGYVDTIIVLMFFSIPILLIEGSNTDKETETFK